MSATETFWLRSEEKGKVVAVDAQTHAAFTRANNVTRDVVINNVKVSGPVEVLEMTS